MAQGVAYTDEQKEQIINEALKPYLLLGYSVNRACICASIPASTVQTWIDNDEALRYKIQSWQEYPKQKAREFLLTVLNDKENKYTQKTKTAIAKYVLDRTDKDYKPKNEFTGEDGQPIVLVIGGKQDEPNGDTNKTDNT